MSKAKKYLRKKYEIGGGTGYREPDDTKAKAEALKTSTPDTETVDVSNAPIEKGTGVVGENLASKQGQDTTPVQQSTASVMPTVVRPSPPEKVDDPGRAPEWSGARKSGSPWERHQLELQNWRNANRKHQTYLAELESYTAELNEFLANQGEDVLGDSSGGGAAGEGGGQVDTTGPVTTTESETGAPVGITQKTPEYITPEVEVATTGASTSVPDAPDPAKYRGGRTSGEYKEDLEAWNKEFGDAAAVQAATVSGKEDIQTVGEAGTVTTEGVTATKTVAEAPDPASYPGGSTSSKYKEDLAAWEASGGLPGTMAAPDKITGPEELDAAQYEATKAEMEVPIDAAKGEVSERAVAEVDDATLTERAEAAKRVEAAEAAAMADAVEFDISTGAYVNKVTGKVATVEETREAEAKTREAITGEPAPDGEAAQIMSMYEFNQLEKRTISKDKVVKNLKAQGLKDPEIAKRLADNPELVADEMENMPEDIKTTLSGLPQEALMSAQMESLMAGMEDGEIPTWARPALAKVEANLAKRGMSASSVGRDALFNAIIQSAMPIAQSNAQAIQNATSQDKQIAADFLAKNAGFQQQMNLANLSNDQQMRLANLTAQNQASSENLNAAQQTELANLNTRMQTNLLQGKIAAEMNQAQLTVDQQRAVQNASMVANVDMTKFNAAQQVELTNSKFMQSMVATKFSADQQAAMQNATAMASMDMANLDKNTKLAAQNAQAFLQMDMANLSNEQQATVLQAQQRQQRLLTNQAADNAAKQFGAASQQQTDQFMANLSVQIQQQNVAANQAREQFNATEKNRMAAIDAGNQLQADQFSAQMEADVAKFNEAQDFQRDQWNAANAQAVEQSNVQWRRQANLIDTAAQNAANQQNAQISYNLTSQEVTQLWQQLRDEAAYVRQSYENEMQRKAQLLATAIGNEQLGARNASDAQIWLDSVLD